MFTDIERLRLILVQVRYHQIWAQERKFRCGEGSRAVEITTPSMEKEIKDCMDFILKGPFEQITWLFSPGHAGAVGNERADVLAGAAVIDSNLTLDPPTVLQVPNIYR